jgi:copper chaperone CopZ
MVSTMLIHAQDKKQVITTVFKASITCDNCEAKIMKQLPYEKGVMGVDVDVLNKLITVKYKEIKNTDEKINVAIKKLGYESEIIGHPLVFTALGNCDMCKRRMEDALMNIEGVDVANWDKGAQKLSVLVNTSELSVNDLQQVVAGVGHDTEGVNAEEDIYQLLPDCCKYTRRK